MLKEILTFSHFENFFTADCFFTAIYNHFLFCNTAPSRRKKIIHTRKSSARGSFQNKRSEAEMIIFLYKSGYAKEIGTRENVN